jgi:hypothetical protein
VRSANKTQSPVYELLRKKKWKRGAFKKKKRLCYFCACQLILFFVSGTKGIFIAHAIITNPTDRGGVVYSGLYAEKKKKKKNNNITQTFVFCCIIVPASDGLRVPQHF